MNRREMIKGSAAAAAFALSQNPLSLFGGNGPQTSEMLIPFLDVQPVDPKRPMLKWEQLTSWITPNDQTFSVSHYGQPAGGISKWNLKITGLVSRPKTFSLDEIKSRRSKSVTATLECSGNSSNPGFMGAIGNIRWTGTPLSPLLKECGLSGRAMEVVFFGADEKVEKMREQDYSQNFARSLALDHALSDDVLLAYEMNGEPLPVEHGAPLRLVVPGWFGIAWIKWLTRIEVLDRRYMSKYMAREYVTIRGEERDGRTIWRETSVGPIDVKSIVARAVRLPDGNLRVSGAAWNDGTPLKKVELKIDDGSWLPTRLDKRQHAKHAWTFWSFDWKNPASGDHTLVCRATDVAGRIQPSADDPAIKLKKTYWEANQQYPRKIRI